MKFAPHSSVEYSPGGFRQATDFRRVARLAAQRAVAKREYNFALERPESLAAFLLETRTGRYTMFRPVYAPFFPF
jgi:hypothetical protein